MRNYEDKYWNTLAIKAKQDMHNCFEALWLAIHDYLTGFVANINAKYGVNDNDGWSIAEDALLRAVADYDPARCDFRGYLSICLSGARISHWARANNKTNLPVTQAESLDCLPSNQDGYDVFDEMPHYLDSPYEICCALEAIETRLAKTEPKGLQQRIHYWVRVQGLTRVECANKLNVSLKQIDNAFCRSPKLYKNSQYAAALAKERRQRRRRGGK